MKVLDAGRMSRRQLLGLIGAGVGARVASDLVEPQGFAALQAQGAARAVPIPRGAIIRTILKDVTPDQLGNGSILFHEHLSFDAAFFGKMRPANAPKPTTPTHESYLEDVDVVTDELKASGRDGVSCIVDGGHQDMGTNYAHLRTIAEKSGVHVVASGGYYLQLTYPPEVCVRVRGSARRSPRPGRRQVPAGGVRRNRQLAEMTADERKVFRVMAKTQTRTNLPVFTHTSHAGCKQCAVDQLDIIEKAGGDARRFCIGHLSDITDDPKAETHKALAKRGAFLGFDTVGHQIAQGDAKKVALILQVLEAGYEDHVLLSADFASERETKFSGGAGYSSVTTVFLPKLRYAGVKDSTIKKIMVDNPKRFLAFVPPKA